jgi:CRP/FNR family cyclic AMP-dependent transcriptional regulator
MKHLTMEKADFAALAHIAGRLEFFTPFKGAELDILMSHIQLYAFDAGETIFKKGQPSDALYIIYEGQVRIPLNRHWLWLIRKSATLKPGNLFGEMSLLDARPHSATVTATQPTKLFVLLRRDFDLLLERNPLFADGMRLIADRRKFEDTH